MWVLTENGELINLDRFYAVDVRFSEVTGSSWRNSSRHQVVARSEREFSVVLCSCDDEEHGREIIQHIANALENGVELYDIRGAKVSVYTCGVCDRRFEVPRRGGKVHYLLYDAVCPDCWAAEQAKAAT